ncbi:Putative short chain dehydrogenase/reductase [Mycobacteroides abscessus subsp. massiliense]|nr:Putative short chain dehydrogenase/reductase [Mycobacteroides abscessus subsp. massiliense]
MDINGSVAIVTGAGSGIGQALAWGLADDGARVVAADIDADAVAATAAISTRPTRALAVVWDWISARPLGTSPSM